MGAPSRPRNRRGQGDRLRADILSVATALLDAGAEPAVTLRAVARGVGITPPSIYPHFLDQTALMLAVVGQAFDDLTSRLRSAAAVEDPRQRLDAICRTYLDYSQQYPRRYLAMFGELQQPVVISLGTEAMQLLTDSVAACVASGHSTSTDPAADALALWLGLHGLAHQRAISGAFRWPTDISRRVAESLAHLTTVRPQPTAVS